MSPMSSGFNNESFQRENLSDDVGTNKEENGDGLGNIRIKITVNAEQKLVVN